MSRPFGGHPTFGAYLTWAREMGCKIAQGVLFDDTGRPYSVTRIEAPAGGWVIDVGTQHTDYLVPTTIARFDRRLGLKSPYFSIYDPDQDC